MKVACIGTALADATWTDKKTGVVHEGLDVSIEGRAFKVPCDDVSEIGEYDQLVILGDLRVFDKNWYFSEATVRIATIEDTAFFGGVKPSGLRRRVQVPGRSGAIGLSSGGSEEKKVS